MQSLKRNIRVNLKGEEAIMAKERIDRKMRNMPVDIEQCEDQQEFDRMMKQHMRQAITITHTTAKAFEQLIKPGKEIEMNVDRRIKDKFKKL